MNPDEYNLKAIKELQQTLHPGRILLQHIIHNNQVAGKGNGGRCRMKAGDNLWPSLLRSLRVVPPPFLKRPR